MELVFLAPLVLTATALVWDLREFIGYRVDLAREIYAVAEVIANATDRNPVAAATASVTRRFETASAGRLTVAIVTRGTLREAGVRCVDDDAWCLPMVSVAWPTTPELAAWNDGGRCETAPRDGLPEAGEHFPADQPVLPNEDGSGLAPQREWISRNLHPSEWWVVIESCLDPSPGLFWGRLAGMRDGLFDLSAMVLRRRAVWGSVHNVEDCTWCVAG